MADVFDFDSWKQSLPPEVVGVLEDNGFDSYNALINATADDLACLNLKRGHLVCLRAAITDIPRASPAPCQSPTASGTVLPTSAALPLLCDTPHVVPANVTVAHENRNSTEQTGKASKTDEEYRFIMFGKTGSGKSTTGNTILGEKKFNQEVSLSSVTSDCELQRVEKDGMRIEILDCPGLYDTKRPQHEISLSIIKAVACMHPGPHAILYIMRLDRFTSEEYGVYKCLKVLFDDKIAKYIILLITGGDELEKRGKSISSLLESAPSDLRSVLGECNNRCLVFNNNAEDTKPQVEKLLMMVKQIVMENKGKPYECPKYQTIGLSLEDEVHKRLDAVLKPNVEQEKYIKELELKAKKAEAALREARFEIQTKDEARQKQLEEAQRKFEMDKRRLELELHEISKARWEQDDEAKKLEKEHSRKIEEVTTKTKDLDCAAGKEKAMLLEEEKCYRLEVERMQQELKNKEENERKNKEEQERLEEALQKLKQQIKEEQELERKELKRKEKEKRLLEEERCREEARKKEERERALREEVDRMKESIAKNQENDFTDTVARSIGNVVTSAVKWIGSWFTGRK